MVYLKNNNNVKVFIDLEDFQYKTCVIVAASHMPYKFRLLPPYNIFIGRFSFFIFISHTTLV